MFIYQVRVLLKDLKNPTSVGVIDAFKICSPLYLHSKIGWVFDNFSERNGVEQFFRVPKFTEAIPFCHTKIDLKNLIRSIVFSLS